MRGVNHPRAGGWTLLILDPELNRGRRPHTKNEDPIQSGLLARLELKSRRSVDDWDGSSLQQLTSIKGLHNYIV